MIGRRSPNQYRHNFTILNDLLSPQGLLRGIFHSSATSRFPFSFPGGCQYLTSSSPVFSPSVLHRPTVLIMPQCKIIIPQSTRAGKIWQFTSGNTFSPSTAITLNSPASTLSQSVKIFVQRPRPASHEVGYA